MSSAASYQMLLSPLRVGTRTLKNRVMMGSMHTRLEHFADGIARQTAFFVERAKGGAALIVTGGYSPNEAGRLEEGVPPFNSRDAAHELRPMVRAVREAGAVFLLQILHAGRYGRQPQAVGASALRAPINTVKPHALTELEVEQTVEDYVRCAELAAEAGFDGVEVMGSEGYLINQFTAPRTNDRNDAWGGDAERRMRLPVEIVRRTRERLGPGFLIMYRISALDLVEGGNTAEEIAAQAKAVERAGADILNTGIGWHEARIPTIAYFVPRAAWRDATARIKRAVGIPVIASNRINRPDVADEILRAGAADMVSMARPFLADAEFVNKTASGRVDEINVCIACNQACLDFIFRDKVASCLVNPRACNEVEFDALRGSGRRKRVAVIGAGAAGLACAITAAERGHEVDLYERAAEIGGQMNYARVVPGKEFDELLRYFNTRLQRSGVRLHLNSRVQSRDLRDRFDELVVATGVAPRRPDIAGIDHPKVLRYPDVFAGRATPGARIAIIGAGGIGFDMAAFLLHAQQGDTPQARQDFMQEWGVDTAARERGGLIPQSAVTPKRQIFLLQRSPRKIGQTLGVTTGWALRAAIMRHGVTALAGCSYREINDAGLLLAVDGEQRQLEVDNIIICAGQESDRSVYDELVAAGVPAHLIGGADVAAELDALRAIDQGTRHALTL